MLSTIIKAFRGRMRWMKTKRKYDVENKGIYVVMFPDSDRDFNETALSYVDEFLDYRKGTGVVILTTDKWVFENAISFSSRITAVERITPQDYYYYNYYYYYYYGFSEQFIMMSLQGEYGKRLALAEGVHSIEKADMACMGLYIIRNWSKTEASTHG